MPADKHTIFYAWQSDVPGSVGRSFIEKALERAIGRLRDDSLVDPADRPEAEVDRDTRGVPGSPPIAATILAKIEKCSVFVGDLTFVGGSLPGLKSADVFRYFSNPNVLLEYGYALKVHGHERIVAVMNTAYGPPTPLPHLPFDLKHLRAPVCYHLPKDADADQKGKVLETLARDLAERLGPCLRGARATAGQGTPVFVSHSIGDPAEYFTTVGQFLPAQRFPWSDQELKFELPKKSSVYLRLSPKYAVPALDSELKALNLMQSAQLRPMGTELGGFSHIRNGLGALAYAQPVGTQVYNFTQLFLSGELMGLDLKLTHAVKSAALTGRSGVVQIEDLERSCLAALMGFQKFFQTSLQFSYPWRLECGVYGIHDYCLTADGHNMGHFMKPSFVWSSDVSQDGSSVEALRPFFQSLWAAAGIEREISRDMLLERLAASFNP